MKKVLVMCTENACRSQMAEGYLRFYAANRAIFCSAGIKNAHVNPYAVQVMQEDGIDITSFKSATYKSYEGQTFDHLIIVCKELHGSLPNGLHAKKIHFIDIPDPALFQGDKDSTIDEFRSVRELVKTEMLKFIGQEIPQPKRAYALMH